MTRVAVSGNRPASGNRIDPPGDAFDPVRPPEPEDQVPDLLLFYPGLSADLGDTDSFPAFADGFEDRFDRGFSRAFRLCRLRPELSGLDFPAWDGFGGF